MAGNYRILPDRKLTRAEVQARYIAAHPERRKESVHKWNAANATPKQEYNRRWREANPDNRRTNMLRYLYGLTLADYDVLVIAQGGGCAICGKPHMAPSWNGTPKPLHVDHDHETGKIRGLLCANCNGRIGWLESRGDVIRAYLGGDE